MNEPAVRVSGIMPVKREVAIDYFKSYLVIGMVLAHTISLLYTPAGTVCSTMLRAVVTMINLVSFPGFFFCFGYVNYKSYFTKEYKFIKEKLSANAIRILIAYYISAFASAIFLADFDFSIIRTLKVLSFIEMPAYSEFLVAFFLISLLSLLLFNIFKKTIASAWIFIGTILASLAGSIVIPYHRISNNQIGLLIGTYNFAAFPVLQYLCYFLIGIWFAKAKIRYSWWIFCLTAAISLPFAGYCYVYRHLPSRFPPDIFWLTGAAFPLYLYYILSLGSEFWLGRMTLVLTIGRQTLFYLLLSNLLLFALASEVKKGLILSGTVVVLLFGSIMVISHYLSNQVSRRK